MKARGVDVGPSPLFFGCRHEQQDFIYADELKAFASTGVTELHLAFSRMQAEKVDVRDVTRKAADRVWSLIENGAVIYVCGDASRMEPDVRSPDRHSTGQAGCGCLGCDQALRSACRRQPLSRGRLGFELAGRRSASLDRSRIRVRRSVSIAYPAGFCRRSARYSASREMSASRI